MLASTWSRRNAFRQGTNPGRSACLDTETRLGRIVWLLFAVIPVVAVGQGVEVGLIDPWWNFALGRLMIDQHQLIIGDPFSFTPAVSDAINQQWLAQLAWAACFQAASTMGAMALRGMAIIITALASWSTGRSLGASRRALVAASLLTTYLISTNLGVRAQTLAFPLAALTLWGLQRGGRTVFLIVPLTVLWANIHGSFPLAVAFAGAFTLGACLSRRWTDCVRFATATLAAALATGVTPYGFEVWRYAIELSNNSVLRNALAEWAPTTIDTLTGRAFFGEIVLACALIAWRRPRLPLTWVIVVAGIVLFGLSAVRNVVWLGVVGLPLLAIIIDRTLPGLADRPTRLRTLRLLAFALVAVALTPSLINASGLRLTSAPDTTSGEEAALADLSEYLVQHPRDGHLFHDADWGAYLEAHLAPAQQVFVDTRFEVHPAAVWDDYFAVSSAQYDWQQILDQYLVQQVALDPERMPALAQALQSSGEWRQVWETDHASERIEVWARTAATAE
jgi:hypothetical protein